MHPNIQKFMLNCGTPNTNPPTIPPTIITLVSIIAPIMTTLGILEIAMTRTIESINERTPIKQMYGIALVMLGN